MSSSRFHAVEEGTWDDPKLDKLPFEAKGFFVYLFSNYRQRPSGIYRATDEQLAADTRLKTKVVRKYLTGLHQAGAILRDGYWIFVPGYLKRQSKNDHLLSGVRLDIERCDSAPILEAFSERYPLYSQWSGDRRATLRIFGPPDHPTPDHPRPPHPRPKDGLATVPEEVAWGEPCCLIKKYNLETPDNVPAVVSPSRSRLEREAAALRMFGGEDWWTTTFQQYHRSRFLSGKVQPTNGHKSFTPDFDWLLARGKDGIENFVKVHDGRYTDGP